MEPNTAKNFALQLGALIALYVSLTTLLTLLFSVINLSFPDALDSFYQYQGAQETIRFSIALLIVAFPTYLVLTRFVNTIRRKDDGVYLTLMRWLIYLSLLIGGAVLLGDLVFVIHTYLSGEVTERFVLKALSVFVVIGAAFYYYMLDARGYWKQHEQYSLYYGAAATLVVIVALVFGFLNIETPEVVREMRLDEQQVRDLQDIQFRIEEYYRVESGLPDTIDELYVGRPVPNAPPERESYSYAQTGGSSYELCATFALPTQPGVAGEAPVPRPVSDVVVGNYNWDHESGRYCFERTTAGIRTLEERSKQ